MMRAGARPLALALSLLTCRALAQDAVHAPLPAPEALAPTPAQTPPLPAPATLAHATPVDAPDDASGIVELKYLLQRVRVVGNHNTNSDLIKRFVPIQTGSSLDPNDPEIEALRYRLLGTGWFDRVDLRLERGSSPGWVELVIEVEERSTLVFQQLAAGMGWSVEGLRGRTGDDKAPRRRPEPYLGLGIAETNLLGTGRTLSAELLGAPDQGGGALSFYIPSVRLTGWSLRLRGSLVKGREYFGDDDVRVSVGCGLDTAPVDTSDCEESPDAAVVEYWRSGLSVGTSRDVGAFTRLSLEWHGDFVKVPRGGVPVAASERRGRTNDDLSRVPIDFSIEPGRSYVSMLTVGLLYDKRDSAILPTRGTSANFAGDLASALIGSDYSFMRVQASLNHWFPLRWGHTIRVGAFAGAVFGYAPFFYKFFVTDLTDLQPSRILGLNLDHRPAPNLLGGVHDKNGGTAIAQMRQEELAGRIDVEYSWPLVRGRRKFVKAADAFALVGFYGLSDPDDLRVSVPGYRGIAKLPIDLTFDAGVRLDTRIGVFQIGIAKLFWLPFK
ncbi:MAG TPA: BamA/TamA family outer membrane protein [Polyangiales bacterium]|nr:BamA/TamA family outer membrane protein [Polyangiales bacterium]